MTTIRNNPYVKQIVVITDDDGTDVSDVDGIVNMNALRNYDDDRGRKRLGETVPYVHRDHTHMHAVLLPYSSGTTGLPKGVCLTHDNIVSNMLQIDEIDGPYFPHEHKLISPLPFFHIYAFTVSLLYTAWKGQTLITTSGKFDLEQFCSLIEQHEPQRALVVPPILIEFAKNPLLDLYDLSSLRVLASGAASLSREVEDQVHDRLPQTLVKQSWGMSELSPVGCCNSDANARSGSIGPLVPSTAAKIIAGEGAGRGAGPNVPGELYIKGPQVMLGYLDDPEKTSETLGGSGWLRTGDAAYYDEDGYFYITDRMKELIKVRGYPVPPAELEALLLTNPDIADAAVIGVSHERHGEVPRAYVVLKETGGIDDGDDEMSRAIYGWVEERAAPYKRLDGGIVFTDAIPKSASGKILRRVLREQVKKELLKE